MDCYMNNCGGRTSGLSNIYDCSRVGCKSRIRLDMIYPQYHEAVVAEKNDPLTLEELSNMYGQSVLITPGGVWALVFTREGQGQRTILVSNDREADADKEIKLVGPVYRRPPKEEKELTD